MSVTSGSRLSSVLTFRPTMLHTVIRREHQRGCPPPCVMWALLPNLLSMDVKWAETTAYIGAVWKVFFALLSGYGAALHGDLYFLWHWLASVFLTRDGKAVHKLLLLVMYSGSFRTMLSWSGIEPHRVRFTERRHSSANSEHEPSPDPTWKTTGTTSILSGRHPHADECLDSASGDTLRSSSNNYHPLVKTHHLPRFWVLARRSEWSQSNSI